MAKKSMILKQQREPKFSSRPLQPLQAVRPSPRLPAGLRHLPYLLPRAGLQGPDPRREEGLLVKTVPARGRGRGTEPPLPRGVANIVLKGTGCVSQPVPPLTKVNHASGCTRLKNLAFRI